MSTSKAVLPGNGGIVPAGFQNLDICLGALNQYQCWNRKNASP